MKQHPWGMLVLLFISLQLYGSGNGSEIIGQGDDIGYLINAKVLRSFENIHVGDSLQFRAGFEEWPGEIDLTPDDMYEEVKKNGVWELT